MRDAILQLQTQTVRPNKLKQAGVGPQDHPRARRPPAPRGLAQRALDAGGCHAGQTSSRSGKALRVPTANGGGGHPRSGRGGASGRKPAALNRAPAKTLRNQGPAARLERGGVAGPGGRPAPQTQKQPMTRM